ncbi:hypothetical protein GCM10012280_36210 [Wenjunlia tyrosinilytica]|uniref:Uncharacterized protein n=1 Tax=Wenjunlia tyrosinilytica TaxID=1544741 RepID=A0A917ZR24_9ACTN|nr:hypothetical protein GCM10012280_36210 [Wenjunlia tyrosinilytica]
MKPGTRAGRNTGPAGVPRPCPPAQQPSRPPGKRGRPPVANISVPAVRPFGTEYQRDTLSKEFDNADISCLAFPVSGFRCKGPVNFLPSPVRADTGEEFPW